MNNDLQTIFYVTAIVFFTTITLSMVCVAYLLWKLKKQSRALKILVASHVSGLIKARSLGAFGVIAVFFAQLITKNIKKVFNNTPKKK